MSDEPQSNSENTEISGRARSNANLKPFKKGDPRINKNGRPKDFTAWRRLTTELLREPALDKNGQPIIITDGSGHEHIATNAEMIARSWIQSPKRQRDVIEAAFGKVPDEVKVELSWQEEAKQKGYDPDEIKRAAVEAARAAIETSGGADRSGSVADGSGGDRTEGEAD